MKKSVLIALIPAFFCTGIFFVYQKFLQNNSVEEVSTDDVLNSALFTCSENKTIQTFLALCEIEWVIEF